MTTYYIALLNSCICIAVKALLMRFPNECPPFLTPCFVYWNLIEPNITEDSGMEPAFLLTDPVLNGNSWRSFKSRQPFQAMFRQTLPLRNTTQLSTCWIWEGLLKEFTHVKQSANIGICHLYGFSWWNLCNVLNFRGGSSWSTSQTVHLFSALDNYENSNG